MKERIRVRLGAETVLVFGPESVSDERSRRENLTILREISAHVFFGKNKKIRKIIFPRFPGYPEIGKIQFPIFPGYEKLEESDSQYFQDLRKL